MNFSLISKGSLIGAVGAILTGIASCVRIDETLGSDFIPTDQIWKVYPCEAEPLGEGITMEPSDSLSGYSTTRFTFGEIKDSEFISSKGTAFTLVPLADTIDFGIDPEVLQFHFTAVKDTSSTPFGNQKRILQNVRVSALKKPLGSEIIYTGDFSRLDNESNPYLQPHKSITVGVPVYDGGDSLSFDFSKEYSLSVMEGIRKWQAKEKEKRDSMKYYLEEVPGIYICTDAPDGDGGRINMFNLPIEASSGYITGNYAELKLRTRYEGSEEKIDTSFIFFFGPSRFIKDDDTSYPTQYAFNASTNAPTDPDFLENWNAGQKDALYVCGGSGLKPVIRAMKLKEIVEGLIEEQGVDPARTVINKATVILPYNVNGDYEKLDFYPMILSPTVRLRSETDKSLVSYAGLTNSSIESENQGDIDRSRFIYCPDISHHVQEILKLEKGKGEDVSANESDAAFAERVSKYDIWFLIMHEETVTSSSGTGSSEEDFYNNLLYNSYYNNMMYDPYGYGYGYGYGGYGYGGYGYGYDNYYNYYMMAAYANASYGSSTTTSSTIELDKDRFYNAVLNGPGYGTKASEKPSIRITFSAPETTK